MVRKLGARSVLVFLMAQLTFAQRASAKAKMGLKQSVWKPLCDLSEELDASPGHSMQQIVEATKAIEKQTVAAVQAEVFAAAASSPTEATAAGLMAAHYKLATTNALTTLEQRTSRHAVRAASTAAYLKGKLDEYLSLLLQTNEGTSGNNGCMLDNSGNNAVTKNGDNIGDVKCRLKLSRPQPGKRPQTQLTEAGFTAILKGIGGSNSNQDNDKKCSLTSGSSTDGLGTDGNTAADVKFLDGYITAPQTGGAEITIADLSSMDNGKAASSPAWHAAWQAAKDFVGAADPAYKNSTGDITDKDGISDLLKLVWLNKADAATTEVQNELAKYFGKHTEDKWQQLIKKIHDFEIPEKVAGLQAQTKLGEITDTPKLLAILEYYQLQRTNKFLKLTKDLEAEKAKRASSAKIEPEKVCNDIGDKNETVCAKTPGCHFVSTNYECKKSTLTKEDEEKAGVKQAGKDGKTELKCSDKKSEGECNDGCKWDNNACKDSSFLVNKKFALIVSAFLDLVVF
uniref:Variant surface glycoprotein 425 n=1 Tax=Trypanosoma brucei TaxID=5691 RepID=M4SY27_9TRYP|nr:variant surface glycoprotein 425 [Trypanosoma brucei]